MPSYIESQHVLLEQLATGVPLREVLDGVVCLIERFDPQGRCSILLLDEDGTLHHGAAPSLPAAYVAAIDGSPIGPSAGSCGTAVFRGERVVVEDIAADPLWEDYAALALGHGLRACWSTPITSMQGAVLGAFAVYYDTVRAPPPDALEQVDAAVHLAAVAIVRDRDERALRHGEARAHQLARLYAVSSAVNGAIVRVRDPAALYALACRIPVEQGLARVAWVGMYDSAQDQVVPVARYGDDQGYIDTIVLRVHDARVPNGPAAKAMKSERPSISNDVASDPDFQYQALAARAGLGACAAFPLRSDDAVEGVLVLYAEAPGFFRDEEVEVLSSLAEQVAFAVRSARGSRERLRLTEALHERVKELSLLHGFSRGLQGARELDAALLEALVALIPAGWQFPDRCVARLRWRDQEARTDGWDEPSERLGALFGDSSAPQGEIEVGYLGRPSGADADPFLEEERELVRSLGDMLSAFVSRIEAETALRRSEALLRIAGRAARLGGWSLELSEPQVSLTDEACAVLGRPEGTAPTLDDLAGWVEPAALPELRERLRDCIDRGVSCDREVAVILPSGQRRWVRAIAQPEADAEGQIVRISGAVQDVDLRHRLEEKLRQTQKMEAVGRLAGGIAHDFNNLLTVILSYGALLLEGMDEADPTHRDVSEIVRAGERAQDLTHQLLAFSRKQVLQPRVVAPGDVVAELERMLRRLVGDDVLLAVHVAPDAGRVLADPGQLEQVVMNLVVNARDAMPLGGSLTIEVDNVYLDEEAVRVREGLEPGLYVLIAVSDSGEGMDADTLAQVFEPFFTTKDHGKGTGLGLSTVWGIVNQSGGHVAVYSEVGVGTTFTIYLPHVQRDADVPRASVEGLEALHGTESILVVEDDTSVRRIVCAVLRGAGYEVVSAADGAEALRRFGARGASVDLVITDVVMPHLGGRALADQILAADPNVRVLFVSGYTENAIVHRGVLDAGVAFLAKPLTPRSLLRKVREVLDRA